MTAGHVAHESEQTRIAWIGGSSHRIALDAADTDGRLTVVRSSFRGDAASPVHVHPDADETLVLLSGEATIWVGPDRWTAGPGDTVFLPRALPHTYLITSDTAEVITVINPSGMERFFTSAGWDLSRGPVPADWAVSMAALQTAAQESGQIVLGPPLAIGDHMPAQGLAWAPPAPDA